jgi:hypothetical protein
MCNKEKTFVTLTPDGSGLPWRCCSSHWKEILCVLYRFTVLEFLSAVKNDSKKEINFFPGLYFGLKGSKISSACIWVHQV